MNKQTFLSALREKLSGLPQQEVEDRLGFYGEILDDRIEEGLTEEEAVAQLGSVDAVASQIIADIPFVKIARERVKPKRRLRAWEIVLLAVGSPIWAALLIAAIAVFLSLYAVLWSLVASVWAIFGALAGCAPGGVAAGITLCCVGNVISGIFLIGCGLVCAGLAIFLFFGCMAATKGTVWLTKKIALWIKTCFVGKERAE